MFDLIVFATFDDLIKVLEIFSTSNPKKEKKKKGGGVEGEGERRGEGKGRERVFLCVCGGGGGREGVERDRRGHWIKLEEGGMSKIREGRRGIGDEARPRGRQLLTVSCQK